MRSRPADRVDIDLSPRCGIIGPVAPLEKAMTNEDVPELHSIWDEARVSIEQGDYDKAIETYRYILIRYPDEPIAVEHANAYLGDIFLTLRELDAAETHIKKAINIKPEKPDYHYILGFICSIGRRWGEAIQEFEKALEKNRENGEYLRGLGWAVYCSGDKPRGLSCLEEAHRVQPNNANIMTDLAVAHMSYLNTDKAVQYAEEAVLTDPTSTTAQNVLEKVRCFSRVLRQEGTTEQA